MSKSQKQQKYCNYTRLPSSKFILLFVNSTITIIELCLILDYPNATFDSGNMLHSSQEILVTKSGGHIGFLSNLTSAWPWIPCLTFDPAIHYTLDRVLPTIFGGHRAFLNNSASGWPWTIHTWPLTPAICYALVTDFSYQIGRHKAFLRNLTSGWPTCDLWPHNVLCFDHRFF